MANLDVELDRSQVAADGSSVTASVRIQPGMADAEVTRHITMCIDTSGSMSGEKIEKVREGIQWVFGYLADDDHVSIVAFDDEVEVVLPATRWGDIGLEEAEDVVDQLRPGGGTDILGGLEQAYETLSNLSAGADVGRRILLLSDGRDERPTEAFADLARRVRREDAISVPAAGIGDHYDEETIRAVATASDAEWVHLSRASDIENFFGRKVETLGTVVAPRPNLEVDLPPGTTVGDVFLRQPQVRDANFELAGDTLRVFLPDLVEFETQEVVFSVETPPCRAGESFRLADVCLRTHSETTSTTVEVECSSEGTAEQTPEAREVTLRHLETMVRKAAGEGDLERARTMVQQATGEADDAGGRQPADLSDEQTRVQGTDGPDGTVDPAGDATRIQGGPDEDIDDETRIQGGPDEDTDDATRIQGGPGEDIDDETRIQGGPGEDLDDETRIQGGPGEDLDDETRIQGGPDEDIDDETRIQGGPGEDIDEETRIQESGRDLSALRAVMDEEAAGELQTIVDEASADDLESQYETTMIKDEER